MSRKKLRKKQRNRQKNMKKRLKKELRKQQALEQNTNQDIIKKTVKPKKEKKNSKKKRYALIIFSILCVICTLLFLGSNFVLSKINYTDFEDSTQVTDVQLTTEEENLDGLKEVKSEDAEIETVDPLDSIPDVTNILLVGEENWFDQERGRTDSMMILTINKQTQSIKITSLMRDTYVQIPGYYNNRLNASYSLGGIPLLKDTIETNYGITIDNTVLVGFDAFEKIIDTLGGVDIPLTQSEINWMTDELKYDTQKFTEGTNHLNGKEALTYVRIRKVSEVDGENNDFGRTSRQRRLISTIYETYKENGITNTVNIANEILPYITTDLTKTEIMNYLLAVLTIKPDELETFRVPMDGSYSSVSINKMAVLQLDWESNRAALKEFIYGKELIDEIETTTEIIDN